jgi:DNA invertase Pin-like site-specific DNA recombinase
MLIGYARTSTTEQVAGLEAQQRELTQAGCEKLFVEQLSSVATKRPQLDIALEFAREGDEFVVAKPDRLARSLEDLLAIERRLRTKGVSLSVLSMGLNTGDATGRLLLQVMGAIAEFERTLMLERQREGVAKAKAEGKYKGRAPTAQVKAAEVVRLRGDGVKPTEIAKRLSIGRASVYRILSGTKLAA